MHVFKPVMFCKATPFAEDILFNLLIFNERNTSWFGSKPSEEVDDVHVQNFYFYLILND